MEKHSKNLFAGKNIDTAHQNMVMTYLSHGVFALWRNWFLSGCQMDKDEMVRFSTQLVRQDLDSIN
ncbi:TetR-like C-terminal domain-containing protein [Clostridium estertheticum]|uniref:TetR family transcriptional regulator C-terminal domain-containing protein n=1 Tax=Clostridium estertheticum TaxID=238834 RepID=A0AA47I9F3_9CLOT|nr:TetR family transcriptional regulator C-terminal domain-containing protein [Clostridium estertheticum]